MTREASNSPHPVMYAIANKYQDDVWVNLKTGQDTYDLNFECLLPSKELADDHIEDVLSTDYEAIPVTILSYRDGVWALEHGGPKEWSAEWEGE